jgi:hypothetical protein
MSDIPFINLKGHLKLTQNRFMGPKALIIDQDFNSRVLTLQGHTARLMLNAFGVNGLKSRHHQAEISLGLDLEALKNGLINTDALNQVNTNRITARFENDL